MPCLSNITCFNSRFATSSDRTVYTHPASPLYTKLKYLHDIRHEVQAPVVNRDGVVGTLHAGTSDPDRGFTPYELRLADVPVFLIRQTEAQVAAHVTTELVR